MINKSGQQKLIIKNTLKYYSSVLTASRSFLAPVLILEVPLAADTKKINPTNPAIPKIAAKGSKVNENIKTIKSR